MPKTIFVFLALIFATTSSFSRDSLLYKSRWIGSASIGYNFPLTHLKTGAITDNLISYSDNGAFYWQLFSTTYFLKKHWGVALDLAFGDGDTGGNGRFKNEMNYQYGSNYYVQTSVRDYGSVSQPAFFGKVYNFQLGLVYRFETKRYFVYPKVSVGDFGYSASSAQAYLKQKNSNSISSVSYNPKNYSNDFFIVTTTLTCGYKLSKRISLKLDLTGSRHQASIGYLKTTTDLATNQESSERIGYSKAIWNLSLGAGVIFVIK